MHMKVKWKTGDDRLLKVVYGRPRYQHHQSLWDTLVDIATDVEGVSQPTLWQKGDMRLTGASSKERKRTESPPTFI